MTEQEDWAASIDPPSADDGPQQPVDWRFLEKATHPVYADDYGDETPLRQEDIDAARVHGETRAWDEA
jgi:hypothetical protein